MSDAHDPHDPHKPRRPTRPLPRGALTRLLLVVALVGGYFWAKAAKERARERIAALTEEIARRRDELAVKLWDARTGEVVATLKTPKGVVMRAAFTADGKKLAGAATDKCVYLWNLDTPAAEPERFGGFEDECRGVAVTPDGGRVAGVDRLGAVRVWEATNPAAPVAVFPGGGRGKWVPFVSFVGSDRNLVFTTDPNQLARFWKVDENPSRKVLEFDRAGAWALGPGRRAAFAPPEPGAAVQVWDLAAGRQSGLVPPPPRLTFKRLRFVASHTRLAAVLDDGTVRVFDPATGVGLLTLPVLADEGTVLGADPGDRRRLYTAGAAGVFAWDPLTGARIGAFPAPPGESFSSLTRDGPYLVGNRVGSGAVVWRVPDTEGPGPWTAEVCRLGGDTATPTFNRDASLVVRGGQLVNPETGKVVTVLVGADPANGLLFGTFSPDGRVLAGVTR